MFDLIFIQNSFLYRYEVCTNILLRIAFFTRTYTCTDGSGFHCRWRPLHYTYQSSVCGATSTYASLDRSSSELARPGDVRGRVQRASPSRKRPARHVGTVARHSRTATWPAHASSKAPPPAVAIRWRSDDRDAWTTRGRRRRRRTPCARVSFARQGPCPAPAGSDGQEASRPRRQGGGFGCVACRRRRRRRCRDRRSPSPPWGPRRPAGRGVMCRDYWEEAAAIGQLVATCRLCICCSCALRSRQNHLFLRFSVTSNF